MRIHLVLGLLTCLLLYLTTRPTLPVVLFDFEQVDAQAADLAAHPKTRVRKAAPLPILRWSESQYRQIHWLDEDSLWRDQGLPFQIKFHHLGHKYDTPVEIFQSSQRGAVIIPFSSRSFDYGTTPAPTNLPRNLGYAGFMINSPLNRPDRLEEVADFLGGSDFRALGKNQVYGVSARGIAVNAGQDAATREQFPNFSRFWLRQPDRDSKTLVFHALLEGDSVMGAYEFHITPGDDTQVRVKARLHFYRQVKSVGLAPISTMYWYGENSRRLYNPIQPEVHNSDGLLIHTSADEWTWLPLTEAAALDVRRFPAAAVKGFGLLQRDRDFSHYQDLAATYNQRPNLWIEPLRTWGKGAVELIQAPADSPAENNVIVSWVPDPLPKPGDTLELEYKMHWTLDLPAAPDLAFCKETRVVSDDEPRERRFQLDFAGPRISQLPADQEQDLRAEIRVLPERAVTDIKLVKNTYDNSWRATFAIGAAPSPASAPATITCRLRRNGETLSETWTSQW